jgi:hypothetical protein
VKIRIYRIRKASDREGDDRRRAMTLAAARIRFVRQALWLPGGRRRLARDDGRLVAQ